METTAQTVQTVDSTLRLPAALNEKIATEAKNNRRTKHGQIIFILENFFRENHTTKTEPRSAEETVGAVN